MPVRQASCRRKKGDSKRPEWRDETTDVSKYRLLPEDAEAKRNARLSKNRHYVSEQDMRRWEAEMASDPLERAGKATCLIT